MPFDPGTLQALETILSDGFEFHRAMDAFIIRAGVPTQQLADARSRADVAAKNSARRWPNPPKRYVVQELITNLTGLGEAGDRYVAGLLSAVRKHNFANASASAREAMAQLEHCFERDHDERTTRERLHQLELERRARDEDRERERVHAEREANRQKFGSSFFALMEETNHQQRGYALERFLNEFFDFEGLDPRKSFKLIGEQIDGSFSWKGKTHLTEAKWAKDPVAGAEFGAFIYKIEGKTADTRGLYISANGYSPKALEGLKGKGALRFVCIDGAHVVRALAAGQSFQRVLEKVWRHADETGVAYLPVSEM